MVLDWRALNALTVKNACASTDVQSLLDQIGNKRIFSVCDAMSAYHQIGLHPEDRPKTAFRTPLGHFQYTVLGFGLVNSPAIWTTCILNILRDLIGVDCLVYMDDIIIMSTTRENHPAAVQRVLDKLRHHKIYLKARKCKWALEDGGVFRLPHQRKRSTSIGIQNSGAQSLADAHKPPVLTYVTLCVVLLDIYIQSDPFGVSEHHNNQGQCLQSRMTQQMVPPPPDEQPTSASNQIRRWTSSWTLNLLR